MSDVYTSSVPQPTFGDAGFVAPAESDIATGVEADLNAAFGGDLNFGDGTPEDQLRTTTTADIAGANDQFLFLAAQMDPAFASGRFQDGIGRLYFLTRNPATSTTVTVTIVGQAGVHIPLGALATDTAGNSYACTGAVTIPAGGSITTTFANTQTGPIPCPANTLTTIYRTIPGWNTINNPSDGVPGNNVESRAAFEARRQASVAGNSFGAIGAILGNIAQTVPGVIDFWGYNNGTGSPVTVSGVTVPAHSVYITVAGGVAASVALAIFQKIAPGCGMAGNTTETVTDPNPLYGTPPTYSITFENPADLPIIVAVSIANSSAVPANALALVQGAVNTAFLGQDGGQRARIGTAIFALRFATGIQALGSWAQLVDIGIGSANTTSASFTGAIAGTALTVSSVTGTINIGDTVEGVNVLSGTTIVSGSGSSWVVSQTQTVSSEAMITITPDLNDLAVNGNQIPTLNVADVSLALV